MKSFIQIILCTFFLALPGYSVAQSTADKLYAEGIALQKIQRISKQREAINKFKAAKIAYATVDGKNKCDAQISACQRIIKKLTPAKKEEKEEEVVAPITTPEPEPVTEVKKRTDVRLSLSTTGLDFKGKPKEGAMQVVQVSCNYDDWEIASHPDWTTVYTAKNEFSVKVDENTGDRRHGIIKVRCEDREVDLVVSQEKKGWKDKVKGFMKNENVK